jgi:osmotically-inducible protein OsmY
MSPSRRAVTVAACLVACAWLVGCKRAPERSPTEPAARAGSPVSGDLKDVAKATEKTAKDIGHASVDLADKAGRGLKDVTNEASVNGQDAWITTKVKGELASAGLGPLHVHVDTDDKVVTLSGTVKSSTEAQKAVSVAKGVAGVSAVKDHLFVKP